MKKTDAEWKATLTPEQYRVMREKGTERAFTGAYYDTKDEGVYRCAACGTPLFSSGTKYDSGSGWPSFWAPVLAENLRFENDEGWFARRVEVLCAACDGHLGHVFDDGPAPTHKRYCINSAALQLERKGDEESEPVEG